jgi:Transposase DDE domain
MPTILQKVLRLAMGLGTKHLADYGAVRSRHDFTQRQLMSCLVLRAYLKTTYRGVLEVLASSEELRRELGMEEKLPHFTTLQKFSARSEVVEIAQQMIASIGRPSVSEKQDQAAAMDSTGLSAGVASQYFHSRRGTSCRQWVKLSVVIWCGSLLPMALCLDLGPSNDRVQVPSLLDQAQRVGRPATMYADAGYDAEWIHQRCREQWGVESIIKPYMKRADGTRGGKWRSQMSAEHLQERSYGRRWAAESFFSGLKRKVGSTISARRPNQMLAQAAFMVLAYSLFR